MGAGCGAGAQLAAGGGERYGNKEEVTPAGWATKTAKVNNAQSVLVSQQLERGSFLDIIT